MVTLIMICPGGVICIAVVKEIEHLIDYRLDDYLTTLYGLQSLFASEADITQATWQRYCESLNMHRRIPGIYSLSYSPRLSEVDQRNFVKSVRSDPQVSTQTLPEFDNDSDVDTRPALPGPEEYYVVTYIWPGEKYRQIHGSDQFADSLRQSLIKKARDTGEPVANSQIEWLSDGEKTISSFVLVLPVYKTADTLSTVTERRSTMMGVITAVFKMRDMLETILTSSQKYSSIDINILDELNVIRDTKMGDHKDLISTEVLSNRRSLTKRSYLDILGQTWSIDFSAKPGFGLNKAEVSLPIYVLSVGILMSILLASTIFVLMNSRMRALQLAEQMTKDLEKQRALSMRSDRLRSLGQMAAGIAHELNQPLVGVRGLAEHILIGKQRGWHLDEQTVQDKISLIVEQADRMSHIIEHVRVFSREAGKTETRPVDVNEVVESSINLLDAQFSSHGLILSKELTEGLPLVNANPFSLEEVFLNLIINGRDAVEEKLAGNVELESPGVCIRTAKLNKNGRNTVIITVTDNGVGIPSDVQSKIFDPFFTTKAPQKGTGLGLAICKSIIEEFDGNLVVASIPDDHTTITVTLPVAPKSPNLTKT